MNTYDRRLPLPRLKFVDGVSVKFCTDDEHRSDDVQLSADLRRRGGRVTCHGKYVRVAYVCLFGVDVDDSYRSP